MNVTADTPVQDILDAQNENQRALMSRLAMSVFGRHGGGTLRAFTQFQFKELGAVIEAKRKGVFDYGVAIRDTATGPTWPKDTKAVMVAIDAAIKGESVDLSSLNVLDKDGNTLVDLKNLFPDVDITLAKAVVEAPAPVVEVTAPTPVAKPVVEEPAASRQVIPMRERAAPTPKVEESSWTQVDAQGGLLGAADVMERLDKLSNGMADAFETVVSEVKKIDQGRTSAIEDELGYVKNEVENAKAGILGLFGVLEVIDRNQRQILDWIVGEGVIEFEDLPKDAVSMIKLAVPEDIDDRLEADKPRPKGLQAALTNAADKIEAEVSIPPEPGGETKWYTREELEAMDVASLRALAEKVGVERARWAKTNVNRIIDEQDRQKKALAS